MDRQDEKGSGNRKNNHSPVGDDNKAMVIMEKPHVEQCGRKLSGHWEYVILLPPRTP